jgi:hypothetical protein
MRVDRQLILNRCREICYEDVNKTDVTQHTVQRPVFVANVDKHRIEYEHWLGACLDS